MKIWIILSVFILFLFDSALLLKENHVNTVFINFSIALALKTA